MLKRLFSLLLGLVLISPAFPQTNSGLKSLLDNYQYTLIVEWDQTDSVYLQNATEKFSRDLEALIAEGHAPEVLLQESLSLIPNEKTKSDLTYALGLYHNKSLSSAELKSFFEEELKHMHIQGVSWSPVTKVLVGAAIGYAVFKILLLTIYYWDYDPNYQGSTEPPPLPPKP